MPGFIQKYIESRGKEPYQVLYEHHKAMIEQYNQEEEKKKREEEEKKYIQKLGKEFAQSVQQELNKLFK